PAGATEDAIATVPAGSPPSANGYALYNRQLHVSNGPASPGGMLTFITPCRGRTVSAPGHFARPRRAARAGRPRRTRLVRLLAGVGLAVGITALARWLASPAGDGAPREETSEQRAAAAWKRPLVSDDGLVERSGVRIVRVAVTGGGGLL